MKRLFSLIILLCMLAPTTVHALDECFTGSWYDPATPNSGINIEVLENVVVAYFYTPGEWLTMIADRPEDGYVDLRLMQTTGYGTRYVGYAVIEIIDNNALFFNYNQKLDFYRVDAAIPWCIGCSGEFEYIRLTQPIPCE